jgi:hypothetical protein
MISITISSQVPPTEMKTLRIPSTSILRSSNFLSPNASVHSLVAASASWIAVLEVHPGLRDRVGEDQEALLLDCAGDHFGDLLGFLDRSGHVAREWRAGVAQHRRAHAEGGQERTADTLVVIGDRHPFGKADDRVLGHGVGKVAVAGQDAGHRSGQDQVAAAARQHARQDRAGSVDMRHHVDVPLLLPDLQIGGQRVAAVGDARIAEEDVDRTELGLDPGDQIVDRAFLADIAGDRQAADFRRDHSGDIVVEVGDRDLCAASGEVAGARRADAAGAAGDDRDLSLELHLSTVCCRFTRFGWGSL